MFPRNKNGIARTGLFSVFCLVGFFYSFAAQAQTAVLADVRREAAEIQRLIENAQALARQIDATEQYMKQVGVAKRAISVTAADPKQAEEVRSIAARTLLADPVAARVLLDPSSSRVLTKPITIAVKSGDRCWTYGAAGVLAGGREGCDFRIDVAPHSGYEDMLRNCLIHEVGGHGGGYMRCGAAYDAMPRAVREGVSVLQETPEKKAVYYRILQAILVKNGSLPFPVEALLKMDYPSDKKTQSLFYGESMALSEMLVARLADRMGPEGQRGDHATAVLYFGLAAKERGLQSALLQYKKEFGIKNVADFEQLLRGWTEEKQL